MLFLNPAYLAAFLFHWIVNFNTIYYSSKVCPSYHQAKSVAVAFKYWSGPVKCYFNYVSINKILVSNS